jgi:hypothetical protein
MARRAAVWPWWLLRAGVSVQVMLAFAQPVLAGRFLAGDFAMLALHRTNGSLVGSLTLAQLVATVLAVRYGGAPVRLVIAVALLGAGTALQLFLGFNHIIGLHIPLGVTLVALNGWLLCWAWTRGPRARSTAAQRRR